MHVDLMQTMEPNNPCWHAYIDIHFISILQSLQALESPEGLIQPHTPWHREKL